MDGCEYSPNHDAAVAFLDYMSRPEVNAQWCATTQEISALSGVSTDGLSEASQEVSALIASGQVANYDSVGAFSGQYYTTWGGHLRTMHWWKT